MTGWTGSTPRCPTRHGAACSKHYGAATPELAWVGDEPGGAHALRVLRRRGRFPVTLHLLAPFDPAAVGNRKAIATRARAAIEDAA